MAQNNRQIQISVAVLEELLTSADLVSGFVNAEGNTEAKNALARLNRAMSSAVTLLRSANGPGTFSGNEVGEYRVDPTQSPFL